jgi:hypothetical protein
LELPVELEYGEDVAAQYIVSDIEVLTSSLTFILIGKHTDYLSRDKCGVDGCNPKSGCC